MRSAGAENAVRGRHSIVRPPLQIVRAKRPSLTSHANTYYGSPAKWQKIYNANCDTVTNPNAVRPGTKLVLLD